MNRVDYYFRQRVTEAELDKGFQYAEDALWNLAIDHDMIGVSSGLGVSQQGSPNLTVAVAAGAAYDQSGRRIRVASSQNVNCAVDFNGISTAVASGGNEKWLGIFLGFARSLSDPRTDGNSLTVYFERAESFEFRVVSGAEATAGAAVRPALDGTRILLADVKLAFAQTTIVTGDISTTRRQDIFASVGSPRSVTQGTAKAAIADLLTYYNNHVNGAADKHAAAMIDYGGGTTWNDGTTNPATDVESQLDKIVADLRATTGDVKIGSPARTGASYSLNSASVGAQLAQLLSHLNGFGTRNAANGYASLDSSAKVTRSLLTCSVIEVAFSNSGAATLNNPGSSDVDIPNTTLTLNTSLVAGDKIEVECHGFAELNANASASYVRIRIGAAPEDSTQTEMRSASSAARIPFTVRHLYTVTASDVTAGSVTAKARGSSQAGATPFFTVTAMLAKHWRP